VTSYTKATDFAAKDALLTGNPSKLVKGTEINTEFTAIETAVNSKADSSSSSAFTAGATTVTTLTTSGQIIFPAVQNPSANANTLDDYEEGTWTPTILGTTTSGTGTYTVQSGTYTKIGRIIYFKGVVTWTAHTGTGNLQLSGLPFASSATANTFSPLTFYVDTGLTLSANSVIQGFVDAGVSFVRLLQYTTGGGSASFIPMDTAAGFMVSGYYEI
jgi:hypothetical protein